VIKERDELSDKYERNWLAGLATRRRLSGVVLEDDNEHVSAISSVTYRLLRYDILNHDARQIPRVTCF
jgi:hypothetical protein